MQEYTVEVYTKEENSWAKEMWFKLGTQELHRLGNLPAFTSQDGHLQYYEDDRIHRTDGPAIIRPDGYSAHYLEGIYYSKEDFAAEIAKRNAPPVKELSVEEISKLLGYEVKVVKS